MNVGVEGYGVVVGLGRVAVVGKMSAVAVGTIGVTIGATCAVLVAENGVDIVAGTQPDIKNINEKRLARCIFM